MDVERVALLASEWRRIFGFLDNTGFRTTAAGRAIRRKFGFHDNIQDLFIVVILWVMVSRCRQ